MGEMGIRPPPLPALDGVCTVRLFGFLLMVMTLPLFVVSCVAQKALLGLIGV
jgi:hypothetical protein